MKPREHLTKNSILQIKSSKDANGDKLYLGCVVNYDGQLWHIVDFRRSGVSTRAELGQQGTDKTIWVAARDIGK